MARRQPIEPRLELTPLIDVVFLLLTFFVFAMVLSARLEVTDVRLPARARASRPSRRPTRCSP